MRRRRLTPVFAIVTVVAACGSPAPSPSPSPVPAASPSATAPATPSTPVATPSTPAATSAAPSAVAPPASPAATLATGGLEWSPGDRHETASITVPLDYANPGAGTILLTVARRQATDPARRIGTLFLNPGGPGGSGVDFIDGADGALPAEVVQRFDLVSWDPRGVGQSGGLTCPDGAAITKIEGLDPTPTRPEDVTAYRTAFDAIATQCQAASGNLLPYLAEANTARDMDAIRSAMGETTLSYWGFSYGTYLGYLYATTFPEHVRAAIFDGPVDPTQDLLARDQGQAHGFQTAFDHELALCAASRACPFWNGGHPQAAYAALLAGLDRKPLSTPNGTLGPGEAVTGVILMLYGNDPRGLMQLLADAQRGDGSGLLGAANYYYQQVQMGSYLATYCTDVPRPSTPAEIDKALATTQSVAPDFGALILLDDAYGCIDWPVAAQPLALPAPPQGLPPTLVISSTWDPATPPWDAAPLAKALGTGVVLTRDGLGHTTSGSAARNPCVRTATAAYLTGLTLPVAGTVCKDPPPSFGP